MDIRLVEEINRIKMLPLPVTWKPIRSAPDGRGYRRSDGLQVLASADVEDDGQIWTHVSFSHLSRLPTYADLVAVKHLFIGDDRWAIQVHAPADKHVNIHRYCLHLWSPLNYYPLPDFSRGTGSI